MCCECVANVLLLSCQCVANVLSMTDMFTAICDKTADEITKIVADGKTAGRCSDTGAAFSLPAKATTAAPASTPKPASAGLLSATWALVLTAPVVAYALLV